MRQQKDLPIAEAIIDKNSYPSDINTISMKSLSQYVVSIYNIPSLVNLVILATLLSMYISIGFTNYNTKSLNVFIIFLTLYVALLFLLLLNKKIDIHSLILSFILFMVFYNYLPLYIIKNPSPNIYIYLINIFLSIIACFTYYYGYNSVIEISNDLAKQNLLMTVILSFIAAFTADSIIFGSFGPSYFPNYIISSNVDVCSRPSKQSFKCNMYQDGKILNNLNNPNDMN